MISSPASKSKIYDRDLANNGIDVWYFFDIPSKCACVYADKKEVQLLRLGDQDPVPAILHASYVAGIYRVVVGGLIRLLFLEFIKNLLLKIPNTQLQLIFNWNIYIF